MLGAVPMDDESAAPEDAAGADIEQQLALDVPPVVLEPDAAQQLGTTGFGADTPAISDPSPSF